MSSRLAEHRGKNPLYRLFILQLVLILLLLITTIFLGIKLKASHHELQNAITERNGYQELYQQTLQGVVADDTDEAEEDDSFYLDENDDEDNNDNENENDDAEEPNSGTKGNQQSSNNSNSSSNSNGSQKNSTTQGSNQNSSKNSTSSSNATSTKTDWSEVLSSHSEIAVKPEVFFGESYTYYVSSNVNMRAGPDTKYNVLSILSTGKKIQGIAKDGDWTFVKIDEKTFGWVKSSFLSTKAQTTDNSSDTE